MGTRSHTYFIEKGETLNPKVSSIPVPYEHIFGKLYKQYDGYPDGWGKELAEFIASGELVNGIPFGGNKRYFNGAGCMAAFVVANFKDGAGGLYLRPTQHNDDAVSYTYHVICNYTNNGLTPTGVTFKVFCCDEVIFEGTVEEFLASKVCNPTDEE